MWRIIQSRIAFPQVDDDQSDVLADNDVWRIIQSRIAFPQVDDDQSDVWGRLVKLVIYCCYSHHLRSPINPIHFIL